MKYLLLLAYLFTGILYSQKSAFNPQKSGEFLYEYAQFVNVGDKNYSIEEIISDSALNYSQLKSDNHSVGFTSSNYWVRFELENTFSQTKTYYLETARPITDIVHLYQIYNDSIAKFESGDQIAFEKRQVNHRETIFKIEVPENTAQVFHIHLKSDGETLNIPLNLYSEFDFLLFTYKQHLFLGLFYGILALAAIIYLFFYSGLREKTFLYYGLYVFSIGLMQAALDGFLYQYLFTGGGYLNSRMVLIAALFSNFFLLKYCESFLKVAIFLPKLKKAYTLIYLIIGLLFVMLFLSEDTFAVVYPLSNINGLLSLGLLLTTLFTLKYYRIRVDPYFSVGIFFLVIGLLGFVLNNLSLIPNNFYTLNSAKFGTAFEVIFLSLSMTNLIRKLRKEKEVSQEVALEKSEEISELKTFFMSNMSHELRTPINAILGVVEGEMDNQQLSKEQRHSLEVIKNASYSLLSNVNDVLDFDRIEKNELILRRTAFNPREVLEQISNNWREEALKKGLEYTCTISSALPECVLGDTDRFVQIVNNILGNAVKFTASGSVVMSINCEVKADGMCYFTLLISDTGVGMDEPEKKDIFQSFSQMRLDHKRRFGGIGLGLTIVHHLVKLFEGSIKIESTLNEGTSVHIALALEVTAPPLDKTKTRNIDTILFHVLIVEDNKLNQMVMKKILGSSPNVTFEVANNGQEALDMLREKAYDLVLMDLQMPVMDGYEATKKIRSGSVGETKKNIPIIAVTADTMEETRTTVLAIGMNDYTTKPVNRDTLFSKIYHCDKRLAIAN